jgi:predicted transcriptional regulator
MVMSLEIDGELERRVLHLASLRNRSPHWIMREAIRQYLERESFKQDAIDAWESYKANGLHLTMDEFAAWLARLEVDKDAEPPKCHE